MILPNQRNTLLEILLKAGYSVKEFTIDDQPLPISGFLQWSITHNKYNYAFSIEEDNDYPFRIRLKPAKSSTSELGYMNYFSEIPSHFERWLKYLQREIDAEEKYQDILNEDEYIQFDSEIPDEKFSPDELKLLHAKLDMLNEKFNQLQLPIEHANKLASDIAYLKEKAEKSSKIDWKNLFVGLFVSTLAQMLLPQETLTSIKEIINSFIRRLLN
ncbi:MAG: hypothetical protein M0D57_04520 [Sphingobacteriales bacterium JAD_PAG50586_3]|nr:MAG: hypothetical protein M0D57_04520 [Sphingobacteriales bacterium JAD_PAG50586_3]